jgi:transcriptional regulator with XRE-family HTH domain
MSSQGTRQIRHIVGANIRFARDAKGLTQHELAIAIGVGSGGHATSRWERGAVLPSMASLERLADVLDQDLSWFYIDHDREAAA